MVNSGPNWEAGSKVKGLTKQNKTSKQTKNRHRQCGDCQSERGPGVEECKVRLNGVRNRFWVVSAGCRVLFLSSLQPHFKSYL